MASTSLNVPVRIPDGPVVRRADDGTLTIEYPNGRPDWFAITPELFEDMVAQINERTHG